MKTNSWPLLLALSLVAPAAKAADWIQWSADAGGNNHWYLPVRTTNIITWAEARTKAQSDGGYLVSLTSQAENAFVYNLSSSTTYWNGEIGPVLGGYQPDGSPEPAGGWTWLSGEPWGYVNWAFPQPDDGGGSPEGGLHFWSGPGEGPGPTWNDFPTNLAFFTSYVVERDTPPGGGIVGTIAGVKESVQASEVLSPRTKRLLLEELQEAKRQLEQFKKKVERLVAPIDPDYAAELKAITDDILGTSDE
jgi:hypothetical protein